MDLTTTEEQVSCSPPMPARSRAIFRSSSSPTSEDDDEFPPGFGPSNLSSGAEPKDTGSPPARSRNREIFRSQSSPTSNDDEFHPGIGPSNLSSGHAVAYREIVPSSSPGFFSYAKIDHSNVVSPFASVTLMFDLKPLPLDLAPPTDVWGVDYVRDGMQRRYNLAANRALVFGLMTYGSLQALRLADFMEEFVAATATENLRETANEVAALARSLFDRLISAASVSFGRASGWKPNDFYWPPGFKTKDSSKSDRNDDCKCQSQSSSQEIVPATTCISDQGFLENEVKERIFSDAVSSTSGGSSSSSETENKDVQVRRFDEDFRFKALIPVMNFLLIQLEAVAQSMVQFAFSIEDLHISRLVVTLASFIRFLQSKYYALEDVMIKHLRSIGGAMWIIDQAATSYRKTDEAGELHDFLDEQLKKTELEEKPTGSREQFAIDPVRNTLERRALSVGEIAARTASARFLLEYVARLMEKLATAAMVDVENANTVPELLLVRAQQAWSLAGKYKKLESTVLEQIMITNNAPAPLCSIENIRRRRVTSPVEERWEMEPLILALWFAVIDRIKSSAAGRLQPLIGSNLISWLDGDAVTNKVAELVSATNEFVECCEEDIETVNKRVLNETEGHEQDSATTWMLGLCYLFDARNPSANI